MTYEEAATCIRDLIDHFDELSFYDRYKTALEMAEKALSPMKDPETGLVPCGCGGKPMCGRKLEDEK